ncbi:uncharacterized protein LOC124188874 [Daphnia pulex]|uniref:uncharacterized protein LOC124188874 n=1 Tax=Daphnia pulex TaxID=6669 RepID=UPI001EE00EEE|nr:uncharacterized protein LOC124188874 [Daphnia pulex]
MMRPRSRSRAGQSSNFQRSRSRSPFYNREKHNRFEGKPFRGNSSYHQHGRPDEVRRREEYNRPTNISPRRSPGPYKHRSRSHSPHPRVHHQQNTRKGDFNNDIRRDHRSPVHYDTMYRRSPTPQRLTTEPIPKERCIFRGPEGTVIDLNELKKITVDIRRNLARGTIPASHSPLRYAFNPSDVVLVRRPGEGSRQIFDREELKPRPAEERVIKLAADLPDRLEHQQRSPSRSHDPFAGTSGSSFQQDSRSVDGDGEGDLRFRLMEKKSSEENKERMNADPNFVPQGRYYYEHDNRERYMNRGGRGFAFRGNGRGNYHLNQQGGNSVSGYRGNFRGGGGGNGGGQYRESFRGSYRGKMRSPNWQHDLYDTAPVLDDGKPSSTTQI